VGCRVSQCVVVCCSMLQSVAVRCRVSQCVAKSISRVVFTRAATDTGMCCSVLQCAAVCYSVLQCVAVCCSVLQCVAVRCSVMQCIAVCCNAMQCVAMRCSALQCVGIDEGIPEIPNSIKSICKVWKYCRDVVRIIDPKDGFLGVDITGRYHFFEKRQHAATHYNTLQRTATHGNTLQHTATHCTTLQHTATPGNTLQHTATHCDTLQHAATRCNTLQHTTTHCYTLQHPATRDRSSRRGCRYTGWQKILHILARDILHKFQRPSHLQGLHTGPWNVPLFHRMAEYPSYDGT